MRGGDTSHDRGQMMVVEDQEARKRYSLRIVELWLECVDFAQEAQKYIMRDEAENDVVLEYLARLTRLWKELKPKVENRSELKDLANEYMAFEAFAITPKDLLTQPEQIYKLEEVICKTLDKLGLTTLESIK